MIVQHTSSPTKLIQRKPTYRVLTRQYKPFLVMVIIISIMATPPMTTNISPAVVSPEKQTEYLTVTGAQNHGPLESPTEEVNRVLREYRKDQSEQK